MIRTDLDPFPGAGRFYWLDSFLGCFSKSSRNILAIVLPTQILFIWVLLWEADSLWDSLWTIYWKAWSPAWQLSLFWDLHKIMSLSSTELSVETWYHIEKAQVPEAQSEFSFGKLTHFPKHVDNGVVPLGDCRLLILALTNQLNMVSVPEACLNSLPSEHILKAHPWLSMNISLWTKVLIKCLHMGLQREWTLSLQSWTFNVYI